MLQTQSVMSPRISQQTLFLLLIGQIYLKVICFIRGIRPAINCRYLVSRVGSAAQLKNIKEA